MTTAYALKHLVDSIRPMTQAEEEAYRHREQQKEEAELVTQRHARLRRSGIIGYVTDQDVELICRSKCNNTEIHRGVTRWQANAKRKPTLMLAGTVGTGKTVSAGWLVAQFGGVFVTAHRCLRVFASRFGSTEDQDRIIRAPFLVLDDVGREPEEERGLMASALLEVLDGRRARDTVVTTNFSLDTFKEQYGDERLISRLRQTATFVQSQEADLRSAKSGA